MSKRHRHIPSPAMIVACIALAVALGGTAVAATQLGRNSVGSRQLRAGAVTAAKLGKGAVTGAKLAAGAVSDDKLAGHFLPASTEGVAVAAVAVAKNGEVLRFFNRAGGAPQVEKTALGLYKLVFPGLEGQLSEKHAIATISLLEGSGGQASRTQDPQGNAIVHIFNRNGTEADEGFDLVLLVPGA